MKKKFTGTLIAFIICHLVRGQLPVGPDGWTVFTPSADTRIFYVDATNGDDATAQYVDASAGIDPFSPGSGIRPYKSITAAASNARDGYPDWILLKRGGTWTNQSIGTFKSGRSGTEPIMIGYYGTTGARPIIKITSSFINFSGKARSHVSLVGLHIYNYKQDPKSPDFDPNQPELTLRLVGSGENILIEDCKLQFVEILSQGYQGTMRNVKIRRSIVTDTYYHNSANDQAHRPSGIFTSETHGLLIEECVFDHNGWNEEIPDAAANQYNHNMYIQYSTSGVVVRNNIVTRGSAHGVQLRGCGILENNLFVQNSIGANLGYHAHDSNYDTIAIAKDNVILEGRHMDPTGVTGNLSTGAVWGIWTSRERFVVENNIVANRLSGSQVNAFPNDNGAVTDYVNNIVYDWDPNRNMNNASWVNPERSVGSYHGTLGKTATFNAFITEARNRPIRTWNNSYTADAVNDYIREGFSVASNQHPTVSFTKTTGTSNPLSVNLTSNASDPDGDALTYIWKIEDVWPVADGEDKVIEQVFFTTKNASYTFSTTGSYKITLTVYDGKGGSATYQETVSPGDSSPFVANLSADAVNGDAPLFVKFTASASGEGSSGSELTYTFTFNDQTQAFSSNPNVSHVFGPGHYEVTLLIESASGQSATDKLLIDVNAPEHTVTDYVVEADAFLNSNSPDANFGSVQNSRISSDQGTGIYRVNYSGNNTEIVIAEFLVDSKFGTNPMFLNYSSDDSWGEHTVTWNNQPSNGTLLGSGIYNVEEWAVFDITEAVQNESDEIISLIMSQNGTGWQEFRYKETSWAQPYLKLTTRPVTSNLSPEARISANQTDGVGPLTIYFDASASTDPDGESLTYTWDFGNGSSFATGQTGSHTFNEPGKYIVSLVVNDGNSASDGNYDIAQVTVNVFEAITGTVNHLNENSSLIYPNPSTGIFFIKKDGNTEVKILSLAGIVLKQLKIAEGNIIDVSDLPTGLYFVETDGQTYKLLIE